MKNKTKKNLKKHSLRLKYLRLQRKKINKRIRCEVATLKRINDKINNNMEYNYELH